MVNIMARSKSKTKMLTESQRLAVLYDAAANVLNADSASKVVQVLSLSLANYIGIDDIFIHQRMPSTNDWRIIATTEGNINPAREKEILKFSESFCEIVSQTREHVYRTEFRSSHDTAEQKASKGGIGTYLCLPLLAGSFVIGALSFATMKENGFLQEDIALLNTIARYVGVVLHRLHTDSEINTAKWRSRTLLMSAPTSAVLLQPGSLKIVSASDRACLDLGFTMDDFLSLCLSDLEIPNRSEPSLMPSARQLGTKSMELTTHLRHRSGNILDVLVHIEGIEIDNQNLIYASWTNITEISQLRRELEGSEGQLRSILETIPDAMIVIDENGRVTSFSATAERLFGWSRSEILGQDVSVLMPGPDKLHHASYLSRYLRTHERRIIGVGRRVQGQRRDGSIFPMELSIGEVCTQDRYLFTGFIRDLTEQESSQRRLSDLQAELQHVSRLSIAGEMASALAHELNQPLTAIASSMKAASRFLETSPHYAELPQRALEAMHRAAGQSLRAGQIVQRLRDFVMKREAKKSPEMVHDIIGDACALAALDTRQQGINVIVSIDPHLPLVMVDRVQIQQVILNLIRNSKEAMSEMNDTKPKQIQISASGGRSRVLEISVSDTGPGLSSTVVSRLFEPFVTTKRNGMGVGLSICRSIVEAHGGQLWSEAHSTSGAVFRFTLPTAPSISEPRREEKP